MLETIPFIMQVIRETMRAHRARDLTVPQFRTLAFLYHNPDISLSEAAEHIGIGLPSTSKLIDALVARELIARTEDAADRRCKRLRITPAGKKCFLAVHQHAEALLAEHLSGLSRSEAQLLLSAMELLRKNLAPKAPAGGAPERNE